MRPSLPSSTIQVRTYEQFEGFIGEFARRRYPLLVVLGKPGLAKSPSVKHALQGVDHLYLETHATALGIYRDLYEQRAVAFLAIPSPEPQSLTHFGRRGWRGPQTDRFWPVPPR